MTMSADQAPAVTAGEYAEGATSFPQLFRLSLRAHAVFFILVVLYMSAELVLTSLYAPHSASNLTSFSISFITTAMPILLLAVVTMRFCRLAIVERPDRPLKALLRDLKGFFGCPRRLANGLPVVIILFLFMLTFGAFKGHIPDYNPFSWDATFFELDRAIHFGTDPWALMQPVLGYPPVTFAINFLYNFWFMNMWIIWMWLAFATSHTHLRMQFFLSFVLCWVVGGTVLAIAFSSAGPCYYADVVAGPNPFAPLMDYLHRANDLFPIWALDTQRFLWQGYTGEREIALGISAMPSMHNATAVIFALVGWRTSRALGIALTAYAALILIGSVHLGWHYAIDGYFGAALAIALWWGAGRFVTWYEGTAPVRAYAEAMNRA